MVVRSDVVRSVKAAFVSEHEAIGHQASFEDVYRATLPRLYAFLRSQVALQETAEDLLSRVLVKGFDRWRDKPCDEHTTHWLLKAAKTTLIDHWRVEGRRERVTVTVEELEDAQGAIADPETTLLVKERQRLLLQAISDLQADQRILVGLRFVAGCSNREMSSILGVSEAAIAMRLLRALRALRERLLRVGFQ